MKANTGQWRLIKAKKGQWRLMKANKVQWRLIKANGGFLFSLVYIYRPLVLVFPGWISAGLMLICDLNIFPSLCCCKWFLFPMESSWVLGGSKGGETPWDNKPQPSEMQWHCSPRQPRRIPVTLISHRQQPSLPGFHIIPFHSPNRLSYWGVQNHGRGRHVETGNGSHSHLPVNLKSSIF